MDNKELTYKQILKEYLVMLLLEHDDRLGEINGYGYAMLAELRSKYMFTTKSDIFEIIDKLVDKKEILTEVFQKLYNEYTDEESPRLFIKRIAKEYEIQL